VKGDGDRGWGYLCGEGCRHWSFLILLSLPLTPSLFCNALRQTMYNIENIMPVDIILYISHFVRIIASIGYFNSKISIILYFICTIRLQKYIFYNIIIV
jgi:hypothetical protein